MSLSSYHDQAVDDGDLINEYVKKVFKMCSEGGLLIC